MTDRLYSDGVVNMPVHTKKTNSKDKVLKNRDPETTGHEWDGIQEFNNPDPFWLRGMFYAMLFFALGYWLLYPSWPARYTYGILNWSSHDELANSQKEVEQIRAKYQAEFDAASFSEIMGNTELLSFAIAGGSSAFQNNCSPCHGIGGTGGKGYPNLTTGAWLWGGTIDDIYQTIKYGIRSEHEETRESQMAAFGREKMLNSDQIDSLTKYIRTISGLTKDEKVDSKAKKIFEENCSSCHGIDATGGKDFGAPNLRDAVWLYGSDYKAIYDVIYSGRAGVMPYWTGRLTDSTIRQLAVYVHQLGGGQ
ncbi:cytochrome-c oxidase, cbb3-type subunit III [Candidatus Lariskella endosymbiont of Hedychridium roseum]|uniref:cytochrome-c oxidase, cbb3-type subunit III n=1 Tax=Candidatus Lariskella endosymbiont of Hedychridium roseum TaxID=3077949 RepID=UPI0030CB8879